MLNWIKSFTNKKKTTLVKKPKIKNKKHKRKKVFSPDNKKPSSASSSIKNKSHILSRGEHGISRKNISEHALKVLYRLHKSGYQACLVGGAVRDLILNIQPKDFDIATDATPEQVSALFRNCRLIGRRFRLAHIHFGREIIEVATFRASHDLTESGIQNSSGMIVRDNVFGELSDDVMRRDFTANALYYDISNFKVIDCVNGFTDIQKKQLCMIGDEGRRFREDPVRMLRAIRFSAKLDFSIEDKSKKAIYSLGNLLQDIPPARLYEEVLKLFHGGRAVQGFELLLEYDLLKYLFPTAAKAIMQDETNKKLLLIAMNNTDERIKNKMRVTPAFLFASLLWNPVNTLAKQNSENGMPYSVAMQKSATKILSEQTKSISIPKRFVNTMRDIWGLQTRFNCRTGKRASYILSHEKFRAAYDFLSIRAQLDDALLDDYNFWTKIQEESVQQQKKRLFPASSKHRKNNKKVAKTTIKKPTNS